MFPTQSATIRRSTTRPADAPLSLLHELMAIVRSPFKRLVLGWNWKAALLSACIRAAMFFLTNLSAGRHRAVRAMLVEGVYAALASGLFGAVAQSIRNAQPAWQTGLFLCVIFPAVLQIVQYLVHLGMGTPRLGASMAASLLFAALSALFHWFAMRRGTLLTGGEGNTLSRDLLALPRIGIQFAAELPVWMLRRAHLLPVTVTAGGPQKETGE